MSAQNKDICLSLDDYIKRKNIDGSLCFLDHRKKDRNIDKEELDASLEKIAQKNATKRDKTNSKFDRFNDDYSSSESEDEDDIENISSDVQMMDLSDSKNLESENSSIRFAKEIQKMEHPKCCQIQKHFTTVESKKGIKVKSQQYRIRKQQGNTHWDDRQMNKIKTGRVEKNKRAASQTTKAGLFIEKGNFTYKFADVDGNSPEENAESIIGIVRNKPVIKVINGNNRGQQNQPNVNINMNLNGFLKGMSELLKPFVPSPSPAPKNDEIQIKVAAAEYFEFLQAKRDKITPTNDYNFTNRKQESINEYIVHATTGDGIDMNVVPNTTNLPLNLRFA